MATQTAPRTISTLKAVQSILNSRKRITTLMAGQSVILTVRGNGNIIDVKNKEGEVFIQIGTEDTVLQKKIFNVVCNSDVAIKNKRNQQTLRDAYAAEQAGEVEKAAELYNEYLNKTQISVGILAGHKLYNTLRDGDDLKGKVQLIDGPNGQVLTLDPKSLSIKEAGWGEDTKVDLFAFMLSDENTPEEGAETQDETANAITEDANA